MTAFVRVSGPPNSNFLVGYPGISATLPRIEGKVEIRPSVGVSAPVSISFVTIALYRRETIHPAADSVMKKNLAAPRKELTDIVGKEMLLFKCQAGRVADEILSMDLPFVIFIPYGRAGQDMGRTVPPASLSLPSRTAETSYELVVSIQQGQAEMRKYAFPVPISRYDTLSTFGMYNRPEARESISDHLVTLAISLPRWSYGPLDPVSVHIKLLPNPDWLQKARRVTIQKITIGIEEAITYNHEGDEPTVKINKVAKQTQNVAQKLPEIGYTTNLGLVFPAKDLRDSDGILPRTKSGFPMHNIGAFSTTATLYKIEYFLTVKAHLQSAKDISLRHRIIVCPLHHAGCKEEMDAIEQAAKDAAHLNMENPMLPAPLIVRPSDANALHALGMTTVGSERKLLIE
jgi:hypothetical protein